MTKSGKKLNKKIDKLKNFQYIVLNTSQNQYAGFSAESDIVSLSLTKTAVPNSRYNNITELTMFKDNYFIDRINYIK